MTWSAVSCVIKIALIYLFCKILSKNFHQLSIVCVLVSDVCLSTATSWYSLTRHVTNVSVCTTQIFLMFYFLLLNYCCLFLVCIQRFIVLRSPKFEIANQRFENNKYWIITGTVTIPFLYQLGDSLLIPIQGSIYACSTPYLYGRYQPLFVGLNIVPITALMILIVVLYGVGCRLIWKRFIRIVPVDAKGKDNIIWRRKDTFDIPFHNIELVQNARSSDSLTLSDDAIPIASTGGSGKNIERKGNIKPIKISCKAKKSRSSSYEGIKSRPDAFVSLCNDLQGPNIKRSYNLKDELFTSNEDNINIKQIVNDREHNKNNGKPRRLTVVDQKISNRTWEMRAFFTCLLIAIQTVLLTGPIVYGLWIDVVTGKPASLQLKLILIFPYFMESLIGLFLYTWRFKEIRQVLCKWCTRQK